LAPLQRHHAAFRFASAPGLLGQWRAGVEQGLAAALDVRGKLDLLPFSDFDHGRVHQHAVDEGGGFGPARGIDGVTGVGGVAEEAGDGEVGDADFPEQPALGGQLGFEIVERGWKAGLERIADAFLVGLFLPYHHPHEALVKQAPDAKLAEAAVGIFLEPAGLGAVGGIAGVERVARARLVEIFADDAAVVDHRIAIDQHRDAAQRAEPGEFVVAEEGRDRVDLELDLDLLEQKRGEHLADVRADEAADDGNGHLAVYTTRNSVRPERSRGTLAREVSRLRSTRTGMRGAMTEEVSAKPDKALNDARRVVEAALANPSQRPTIAGFFDEATHTVSYVVHDPVTARAAVIDSVLDYDAASGRTGFESADRIVDYVAEKQLTVDWVIETHAHADHLSAAPYLQGKLGGKLAIGRDIIQVQEVFGKIFNAGTDFERDGSQFDVLFDDGDAFRIGELEAVALHVPGHTPADMAYVIGDAAFVGDTMFMPDYGTARCDFPGGDARQLYRSIRRLLELPRETRIFLCHDYKAPGRDEYAWETTVALQRDHNVHIRDGVTEDQFATMRTDRDKTLAMPELILPSVQVNIRGGRLPDPEDNGVSYIKIPVNRI
jgi:glyoxylase-like metal-dependent hydrolase (beta-lactamase superfamily II)